MDLVFAFVVFLFGLTFGSFLNVCIYRLPREQSVASPGSNCPKCHAEIRWYDNIPVLSWLLLRGRCRDCGARISPRYLLVELLTGVLFLACFLQFGYSLSTFKYCVFSFLTLGLIFIDAEWRLLPDALTLPGIGLGVAFSLLVPVNDLLSQFLPVFAPAAYKLPWRLLSLSESLLGAAVGASFIYGVAVLYLRARGVEGMGLGDVKLMAMVGSFLGVKLTVLTIFGASVLGTLFGMSTILAVWIKRTRRRIVRNREQPQVARRRAWQSARLIYRHYQLPFGVFLGGVAIFALLFGDHALQLYLGLYR